MRTPVFHFHNDHGVPFPSIGAGVREEGMFFRRFVGLIYPGRDSSIIGRGGSGVIHVARDKIMDRVVALKLPNESILAETQVRSEVLNEASQALELTHPNIVRIYDFHDQDGRWGISMQYVRGHNLDEWRDKLAPHQMAGGSFYDADQIKSWVSQLCEALGYAHEEAGIAHCDIKPRNLLLERSFDTRTRQVREKLLLTDFGITQKLRDFTTRTQRHNKVKSPTGSESEEGGAAGTLAYMSPQQLNGAESTIADDIYAMGVTIYELLTGRPPYFQGDAKVIQHQIQSVVPPSMMARRHERGVKSAPPIPDLWEQVIAQCLHKEADKRPASASELARLLGVSTATVSNVSLVEEKRRQQETESLRVTVQTQESKLSAMTTRLQELETSTQGKVDETELLNAQLKIEELEGTLQGKEAQLRELDEQLQDLEEAKNELQQQLAETALTGDEAASKLGQERDALSARIQQAQADAAKMKEERDTAQGALKKSQADLAALNEKHAAAVKEAAEASKRAQTADTRIQQVQDAEAKARKDLEKAQADTARQLAQTRQELESTRRQADAMSGEQISPLRPILMMLLGLILLGGVLGGALGWIFSGGSKSDAVASLVAEVREADTTRGIPVLKRHVQVYLSQLGLDESSLGADFASLPADAPATGLSWLEAASFCEWLTQAAGFEAGVEWFDLPAMNDLPLKEQAGAQEWTREEASLTAAGRRMKVYTHGRPQDQQTATAARTRRSPDTGFHCILRSAP